MKVPFLDLRAHHGPILEQLTAAVHKVISSNHFAGGPVVEEFEEDFAAYCGAPHAIGVGSGTEALWLTLLALDIGPGDEVITSPNTFMATAEAITYCGAKPVFADVDSVNYTINPEKLERAITPRTKAVIPVHIFGQPADLGPIQEITRKHGLLLISDACQAHGAKYRNQPVAAIGDATCFSFYPGKNLGAFGEAGAVVTSHQKLQEKIRILRDHGQVRKYHHSMIGWNCRMDAIQAAVLKVKLTHLDQANQSRRSHAQQYNEGLGGLEGIITPVEAEYAHHVYHIYAIRTSQREELISFLRNCGIECGIHYPVAVHQQEAYRQLGYQPGDFPVAEQCAREFISLPMFPELTRGQIAHVVNSIQDAMAVVDGGAQRVSQPVPMPG